MKLKHTVKIFRNIFFIPFVICFFYSQKDFSQNQKIVTSDYNSLSVGFKFGMLPFYGDVRELHYSANNPYKKTNTGFSLEVNKNLNSIFGVKADVISGGLSGSSPNLNLHFNTNILEYSVSGFVNVNNLISFYPQKEKLLNFYLFAGVGLVDYRSAVFTYDENTFITGYGWSSGGLTKTKRIAEVVYPIGVSVKYKADPKIDVGLEMSLHLTNTDKLDAWVVKNSFADRYGYVAICFTYKIGSKSEYVDWVNPFQDTTNLFAHNPDEKYIVPATSNSIASTTKQNESNTNLSNKKTSADTVKTNTTPIIVKNYFVVSSAYKTRKLAKEAMVKLKNKGFSNAEVIDENNSSIYRVAINSYVTIDEASDKLNSVKKSYPYSKIFEKKSNGEYTEIVIKAINSANQNNADTTKINNAKANLTQNTTAPNINKISTYTTTNQNTSSNNSANNSTVANKTNQTTITNTSTNQTTANNNVKINNTSTSQNNNNSGTSTITQTNSNNNTKANNTVAPNPSITNNDVKTINTTTSKPNNTSTSVIKKFFIIDASFPSEKEANDAVSDLKTKGFGDAEVVGKNAAGGFRICYKGYATREEALKDLPAIKQKSNNPSAWIFENTSISQTSSNSGTSLTTQSISNNANQNATNNNLKTNTTQNNNNSNASIVVKKFYIIAASYPTEKEANDTITYLKTKGFSDAEIVGKNAAGGFRICYKGYATKEEALKDLPAIKQSTNPSAWIFEKK